MIQILINIQGLDRNQMKEDVKIDVLHREQEPSPSEKIHCDIIVDCVKTNLEDFIRANGTGSIVERIN